MVIDEIDRFIAERITHADAEIAKLVIRKIQDGAVILTYSWWVLESAGRREG